MNFSKLIFYKTKVKKKKKKKGMHCPGPETDSPKSQGKRGEKRFQGVKRAGLAGA